MWLTNEQFKRVVDAGGYRDAKYWTQPFRRNGRELTYTEAMRDFRDATGRPGPAGWELGMYPEGAAKHPVPGVSWYEAMAYAAFAGRELPTVYHWYAASGGATSEQLQLSDFSSRALWVVGSGNGPGRMAPTTCPETCVSGAGQPPLTVDDLSSAEPT